MMEDCMAVALGLILAILSLSFLLCLFVAAYFDQRDKNAALLVELQTIRTENAILCEELNQIHQNRLFPPPYSE
jgi:hypothetical protein